MVVDGPETMEVTSIIRNPVSGPLMAGMIQGVATSRLIRGRFARFRKDSGHRLNKTQIFNELSHLDQYSFGVDNNGWSRDDIGETNIRIYKWFISEHICIV